MKLNYVSGITKRRMKLRQAKHKQELMLIWMGIASILIFFGMTGFGIWHTYHIENDQVSSSIAERIVWPDKGLPPELIHVNGDRWSVKPVQYFQDSNGKTLNWLGTTDCVNKVILYIPYPKEPSVMRETIAHELFHAGECAHVNNPFYWNSSEKPKDDADHVGIYHLGSFLSELLHENQELAKWFTES